MSCIGHRLKRRLNMRLENAINLRQTQTQMQLAETIIVAEPVKSHYQVMWDDLVAYYRSYRHLPDEELMVAIDRVFGERLVKEVCTPLEFFQGACAFVALVLLRQSDAR